MKALKTKHFCRTCLNTIPRGSQSFHLNNSESDESAVVKSKLEACVPELTLDIVSDALVCVDCMDALCIAYKFKKKCLETEEKVYDYILQAETNTGNIEINSVVKWLAKYNPYKLNRDLPNKNESAKASSTSSSKNSVLSNENCDFTKHFLIEEKSLRFTSVMQDSSNPPELLLEEDIKTEVVDDDNVSSNNSANGRLQHLEINPVTWSSTTNVIIDTDFKEVPKIENAFSEYLTEEVVNTEGYGTSNGYNNSLEFGDIEKGLLDQAPIKFNDSPISSNNNSPGVIISGLSCRFDHFCEFEQQFKGYTMNEFYSNGLVDLPKCSVVIERLTEEEIERWTSRMKYFTCDLCKHCFESAAAKSKHEKVMHEVYKCVICRYSTPYRKNFIRHRSVHGLKQYSINQVKKSKTEDGKKKYRCTLCNFRAKYSTTLLLHIKTHEKKYVNSLKCLFCSFKTNSEQYLEQHVALHESGKIFACSTCKYTTVDSRYFKKHVNTHIPKMVHCIECNYNCTYKNALYKHYSESHFNVKPKVLPYTCVQCKFKTNTRQYIINHLINHTKKRMDIYLEHNYSTA